MYTSYLLGAVAALVVGAVGQTATDSVTYTLPSPSSTATSSWSKTATSSTSATSGPATHSIAVGADGFVFTPTETKAKVGDTIRYIFYPGGHSVARAAFKFPCIPYEYAVLHKPGFWSGTKTPQAATGNVWFDVKVNDTDPIFFYCAAPGSCSDHHMIGVINPRDNETFDDQMAFAEKVQFQLKPGDPWPSETAGEMPSESESASSDNNTGTDSNSNSDSDSSGGSHPHLSPGVIAGIAIGSAAVLILAAALIYLCGRRGGFDKAHRKSVAPSTSSPGGPNGPMSESGHYAVDGNPKSPGQATFSTYSGPPDHDPYRSLTQSPHHPYYNGSPPPPPAGGGVHPGYPSYQSPASQGGYGLGMGELSAQQYANPHQSPVELPTATTVPGSPPPQYPSQRDSWTVGEEGQYRPGHK